LRAWRSTPTTASWRLRTAISWARSQASWAWAWPPRAASQSVRPYPGIAQAGKLALHGTQAATLIVSSFGKFDQGDYFGGFADLVDAGANLHVMRSCFAPGTPIKCEFSSKYIELIQREEAQNPVMFLGGTGCAFR
jgi:hypothetical protein